ERKPPDEKPGRAEIVNSTAIENAVERHGIKSFCHGLTRGIMGDPVTQYLSLCEYSLPHSVQFNISPPEI
ncbi:MAG: hypothetical protein R8K20_00045, partial [Gallionellaceae bacterium]